MWPMQWGRWCRCLSKCRTLAPGSSIVSSTSYHLASPNLGAVSRRARGTLPAIVHEQRACNGRTGETESQRCVHPWIQKISSMVIYESAQPTWGEHIGDCSMSTVKLRCAAMHLGSLLSRKSGQRFHHVLSLPKTCWMEILKRTRTFDEVEVEAINLLIDCQLHRWTTRVWVPMTSDIRSALRRLQRALGIYRLDGPQISWSSPVAWTGVTSGQRPSHISLHQLPASRRKLALPQGAPHRRYD